MINQIIIEGNLVDDPESEAIRDPETGKHWYKVSFKLGHNYGNDYKEVDYYLVEAFNAVGRYVKEKELRKGDGITVCGQLRLKKWEDDKGVKHRRPYIELDEHGIEINYRKP